MAMRLIGALLLLATPSLGRAETPPVLVVRCGHLLDGVRGASVENAVIVIEGTRIKAAGASLPIPQGSRVIDLGDSTVLPGLIDAHTHVLLQGDVTPTD
jgi:imidazolonepropionase-like amidohydrolase